MGIKMKKCFAAFMISLIFLTGCSSEKEQSTTISNPYEILVKGEMLSYYDTEAQIDKDEFDVFDNGLKGVLNGTNNTIVIDRDKNIRCIIITDSEITTYKQIAVGDSVEKVLDTFDDVNKVRDAYFVLFNGTQEQDPMSEIKDDSWILINYWTEDETITRIVIYDVKYSKTMQ